MVVREKQALYEFERRDAARLDKVLTPAMALRLYDAMWERAKASGALRRGDPLEGLEIDMEVARMVNALGNTGCGRGEPPAGPPHQDTAPDEPAARPYQRQHHV
jgi:hypothetical protein